MNFLQLYGLTETSPLVTGMAPGSTNYSSSGVAVPNTELRIVDGDMNNLGPDEVSRQSEVTTITILKVLMIVLLKNAHFVFALFVSLRL